MPKRRWLRYSLRTMLVVMLVLSVWLGWMANKAARQREAVALVRQLRGSVIYNDGSNRGVINGIIPPPAVVVETPPSEGLLHDILGHDWFYDVWIVGLIGTEVTDDQLGTIAEGLPGIEFIDLEATTITDAGIEHLSCLKKLGTLDVERTNVSANAIAELRARLPNLQVIYGP